MSTLSRGVLPLRCLRQSAKPRWPRPQWQLPTRSRNEAIPGAAARTLTTTRPTTDADLNGPPKVSPSDQAVNENEGFDFKSVRHARPMPVSPSYFSSTPQFNDGIVRLSNLLYKYRDLPLAPKGHAERVAWKTVDDFRAATGEPVKLHQYGRALSMIKRLHQIEPGLAPPEVAEALKEFRKSVDPFLNVPREVRVDGLGRAIGVGKRKSSVARAWVVEGNGEVQVNGRSLSEAFGRVHDRESAVWALQATGRIDKYNVWALVEGGGTTGQAEALTLAIAKGLMAHEPALKPALRRAGCVTRDPRTVERKLHGHRKARKSPAWVKR